MASGEEFVRLSHKELVNLSKRKTAAVMQNDGNKDSGKKHEDKMKKPERPIYMPGQTRLSRKKEGADPQIATSEPGSRNTHELNLSPESLAQKKSKVSDFEPEIGNQAELMSAENSLQNQPDKNNKGNKTSSCKGYSNQRKLALGNKNVSADSGANSNNTSKDHQKYASVSHPNGKSRPEEIAENTDLPLSYYAKTTETWHERLDESETTKSDTRRDRKREKKPDIQLYVPKARQQMLHTKNTGAGQLGESGSVKEAVASEASMANDARASASNVIDKKVNVADSGDVKRNQNLKDPVSVNADRKVTMRTESLVEVTVSRDKREGSFSKQSTEHGSAIRKKKHPKSRGRSGDYRNQHDSRLRKKTVHDGRSPRQKLQHWKLATGAENKMEDYEDEERSDINEVEELEWDHQADLDLNHSQMTMVAIPQKEGKQENEMHLEDRRIGDAGSRFNGVMTKQVRKRRNKKPRRHHMQKKNVDAAGNKTDDDDDDDDDDEEEMVYCKNTNSNLENTSASPNTLINDDNFVGKFDVLVITNSKRRNSSSSVEDMLESNHRVDYNDGLAHPGPVAETDVSLANIPKDASEKLLQGKKIVGEKKSVGTKYCNSGAHRQSECNGKCDVGSPTSEDKQKRKSVAKVEDRSNVHEISSDKLSFSDITLSAKVGGIIRLPFGTTTSGDSKPYHASGPSRHGSKGLSRGRPQTRRTLWDPNQTTKPESSTGYFEPELNEQSSHYMYSNETKTGRDFEYTQPQVPHSSPPFYGSIATFPQCIAMENYGYRFPVPASCFDGSPYDNNLMRDLYYQGYSDQSAIGHQSIPSPHLTALIREAAMCDTQLMNLISHGINSEEILKRMAHIRMEILSHYEQAMLLDLDFCNQQNVPDSLWRSAFYQVIEVFRKQMKESDSEANKTLLLAILDEGIEFFEKLLQKLQTKYNFSLERYLDIEQEVPECSSRTIKLGLISCQRIMMCLGDLARYKELANQSCNYGRARSWYVKAQQIAPKNGKPYNQLAVLAIYTKRKLDAVYYYMRSLAATNPLLTARESLMSLFDEARRKMEQRERNRQMEKAQRKRAKTKQRISEQSHRVEIWISADGTSSQDQIRDEEDDSDDVLGLSIVELNKRFVWSFLHVHGKLFTKIGMETFPEAVSKMLQEFQILVCHSPSPIGYMRLLQLMTINMFAIENTIRKESNCSSSMDGSCRSIMQEQAMQLGLEMFGLLIEQCFHLLHLHLKSCSGGGTERTTTAAFGEDLHQLLPGVKAWSDWMICHSSLWNPPPMPFDPLLGLNVDVWKQMADLFNVISEVDTSAVVLHGKKTEGCKPVLLPEDVALAGFIPLLSITHSPVYVLKEVDKDLARDCLRIDKLRMFAEVVYGLDPAILSYSAETCRYTSLVTSGMKDIVDKDETANEPTSPEKPTEDDDRDIIMESESVEYSDAAASCALENDSQEHNISQLKARKQELTRQVAEQMKKQENLQAAIESSHHDFRRIELEIRPVFLVLDTNCLIDHLKSIQKLLQLRKYTLTIPLVVINELDGLAKNLKESCYDTIEHAEMVRKAAEMAVQFLEAEFEQRNHHLRAVTSKGSTLDTIAFRSEEPHDAGTNDDLILNCCLRYCKDKARDFMPKSSNEPIRLYRDVVLLTNDRNLRLKAHLHNVPVKDIPSFVKWANVS